MRAQPFHDVMDHAGDDEQQRLAVGKRLIEMDLGGVIFRGAGNAERTRAAAFDQGLGNRAALVAQSLDHAEWRKRGEIGQRLGAPALQRVEHVERRGQDLQRQRPQDLHFPAGVNDCDAFDVARGQQGRIGMTGDGERDLDGQFTRTPQDGLGDIGVRANKPFQPIGRNEHRPFIAPLQMRREGIGQCE